MTEWVDFVSSGGDFVSSGGDFVSSGGGFVSSGSDFVSSGDNFVSSGTVFVSETDRSQRKIAWPAARPLWRAVARSGIFTQNSLCAGPLILCQEPPKFQRKRHDFA